MNASEALVHSHSLAQPTTQWTTTSTTTPSQPYLESNDFRDEDNEEKESVQVSHKRTYEEVTQKEKGQRGSARMNILQER